MPGQWLANGSSTSKSNQMNYESQATNEKLKLITKKGCIHLGLVKEQMVSPSSTNAIQLELDFNKTTTDYH